MRPKSDQHQESHTEDNSQPRLELAKLLAKVSGLGWFIASSITLGAIVGWLMDNALMTSPWLLIGGLLLGVLVAFIGAWKLLAYIWK